MPEQGGYTYDELVKMGAKPGGYSFDELKAMGASAGDATPAATQPEPSLLDRAKQYLPGWSTALPIAGGIAGSALGPLGTVAGASIGESLAQIGQHLAGSPEAPQSGTEAFTRHAMVGLGGAAGEAIPALAATHAATPIVKPAVQAARGVISRATQSVPEALGIQPETIFRSPQTLMTRGLNPSDLEFQKNIPIAMNELKAAERHIGPLTSMGKVNQAAEIASRENERVAKMIILPQKDVVVPGSASVLKQAQIRAIPDTVQLTDPAAYDKLVAGIIKGTDKDLTIGELNRVTVSGNKLLSPSYGKTAIDQLTADERIATALKKAQNDAARKLMYEGVDSVGLGGGDSLKTVKERTGAILHFKDALDAKANAMVAQKTPMAVEGVSTIRRGIGQMNPLRSEFRASMEKPPIEQDVLTALRRWRGRSGPIEIKLRPVQASQSRMLPPPKTRLPETGQLHPDDESFVRGFTAGPPYLSHEQMMTGRTPPGVGFPAQSAGHPTYPPAQPPPTPSPVSAPALGQNSEEAATILGRGRRPELLKEGKTFDETAVVNSPLFQGRGGRQAFLPTDVRTETPPSTPYDAAVTDTAQMRLQQFLSEVQSGATEMTGKMRRLDTGELSGRFGGGIKKMFPELKDFDESPSRLAEAIIKDKGNPLYRRVVEASKAYVDDTHGEEIARAVGEAPDAGSFDFGAETKLDKVKKLRQKKDHP